jgi:hypothetical protein
MKTIVWDIDDVMNDLTRAWFETAWLPGHRECRLTYDELKVNPPHEQLGIQKAEYLASLDRFRVSAGAAGCAPDPMLQAWFAANGDRFRHVALTARPQHTITPAVGWLMTHFGAWFQTIGFVPSDRPGQNSNQADRTKGDYLAWLAHAEVFIDDLAENCRAAERLGIQSFLRAQPWNDSRMSLKDILERLTECPGTGKARL